MSCRETPSFFHIALHAKTMLHDDSACGMTCMKLACVKGEVVVGCVDIHRYMASAHDRVQGGCTRKRLSYDLACSTMFSDNSQYSLDAVPGSVYKKPVLGLSACNACEPFLDIASKWLSVSHLCFNYTPLETLGSGSTLNSRHLSDDVEQFTRGDVGFYQVPVRLCFHRLA